MCKRVVFYGICFFIHFMGTIVNAQDYSEKILTDSIQKLLDRSSKYLERISDPEHEESVYLLQTAESLIDKIDNSRLRIKVNRYKIDYLLAIKDTITVKEYLERNLVLIEQVGDKRELGLYYERVGVTKNYEKKKDEEYEAYIKADELLRKYGEKKDLIDANYNLCLLNNRKKEWEKTIEHSLISLQAIKESNVKEQRRIQLYLFLAEAYFGIGEYEKAEECFEKVENDDLFDKGNYNFLGFFNATKGDYYLEIKNFEKAAFFYSKSASNYYKDGFKSTKEVSSSLGLVNKLKIKEEENKRIRIKNELNAEQLTNDRYVKLIGTIVIFGLILMSINQYRSSVYKTKVNNLLKENNRRLFVASQQVDKALKAKSDFLDSVTHELLTPLNTIKGITFLLNKDRLTAEQKSQIGLLSLSSDHLLNLITNVIELNVLENNEAELNNEQFNLKILLNSLLDSLFIGESMTNKLHRQIDNNIPDLLYGDVLKISQVVINILNNSLKFTKNGDIYFAVRLVTYKNSKAKINFYIRDTGIGMSDRQRKLVFENFNQGSIKINRNYGGTGLGLSIVKKILDLHESEISLESKLNVGTTIEFSIDFEIPKVDPKKLYVNGSVRKDFGDINVLLVEDNKVNQLIVKKIISDYGFYCDSANDGEEAVAMAKENEYTIVLMDIMMPKMDGFEATKCIKSFNQKLPIVALTAISEKLNKDKFNEVGIYTVLNKPVKPRLLYETIVRYKKSS